MYPVGQVDPRGVHTSAALARLSCSGVPLTGGREALGQEAKVQLGFGAVRPCPRADDVAAMAGANGGLRHENI